MQNLEREGYALSLPPTFSLWQTMESGQCFRYSWKKERLYLAAGGHVASFEQKGDKLYFYDCTEREIEQFWVPYFTLDFDYLSVQNQFEKDPVMKEALKEVGGVHLLRQEIWETLVCFILSQNNHIPRIKSITRSLCLLFSPAEEENIVPVTFPTPKQLAACSVEDLAPIRAGFRAKYLIDAAKKVCEGQVKLEELETLSYEEAEKELRKINGVGPKVSACVLLFGAKHDEAFPVDVWIARALKELYPDGFDQNFYAPFAGIAQQYLFSYIRLLGRNTCSSE